MFISFSPNNQISLLIFQNSQNWPKSGAYGNLNDDDDDDVDGDDDDDNNNNKPTNKTSTKNWRMKYALCGSKRQHK